MIDTIPAPADWQGYTPIESLRVREFDGFKSLGLSGQSYLNSNPLTWTVEVARWSTAPVVERGATYTARAFVYLRNGQWTRIGGSRVHNSKGAARTAAGMLAAQLGGRIVDGRLWVEIPSVGLVEPEGIWKAHAVKEAAVKAVENRAADEFWAEVRG